MITFSHSHKVASLSQFQQIEPLRNCVTCIPKQLDLITAHSLQQRYSHVHHTPPQGGYITKRINIKHVWKDIVHNEETWSNLWYSLKNWTNLGTPGTQCIRNIRKQQITTDLEGEKMPAKKLKRYAEVRWKVRLRSRACYRKPLFCKRKPWKRANRWFVAATNRKVNDVLMTKCGYVENSFKARKNAIYDRVVWPEEEGIQDESTKNMKKRDQKKRKMRAVANGSICSW